MSRSKKAKVSRPRSGVKADERRIEHQRHRARTRKKLSKDPEALPLHECVWYAGDIWNWD